jgi:hypothetical protein
MNNDAGAALLVDVRRVFEGQRKLAERAVAQLSDEQIFHVLDGEANSVAVIMKHVGGNLRSRWTDFLTTDGEKPDRNRDGEFVSERDTRATIEAVWGSGWQVLDETLSSLSSDDLLRSVSIRGETLTVLAAINRSLAHSAQHVGQIILLAKHLAGPEWQTLSIPRAKPREV